MTGRKYDTIYERIRSKCKEHASGVVETECWIHCGGVCKKGYAYVGIRRPNGPSIGHRAHVVMWETVKGRKLGAGMTLDHLCRIKRCCNPDHMEEVTRAVNTARMRAHRKDFARQMRRHSQVTI